MSEYEIMKISRYVIFCLICISSAVLVSFQLLTTIWVVNTNEATIKFSVPSRGHHGSVGGLKCTFQFDPLHPSESVIDASVEVATISTDKEMLTRHLKTNDFFDAANYPVITFHSDSVVQMDSVFVAFGKLSMRDSVRTIALPFRFYQNGNSATIKGKMELHAGDYGVGKKYGGKDRVLVNIEVPVTKE